MYFNIKNKLIVYFGNYYAHCAVAHVHQLESLHSKLIVWCDLIQSNDQGKVHSIKSSFIKI